MMWPPPKIADPSPPPKPKVVTEAVKPKPEDYYKSTLTDSLMYTGGLGTVLGKTYNEPLVAYVMIFEMHTIIVVLVLVNVFLTIYFV